MNERLVTPLPFSLSLADLDSQLGEATNAGRPSCSGVVVGVGGDGGAFVTLDSSRPVIVVGPVGAARDAAVASLASSASQTGLVLDVQVVESALALPRNLATPTLIFSDPTLRSVRDAFRGDLDGLIDPCPPEGRVLLVSGFDALAVQLALP
jgi:hypothetical protein